MVDVRAHYFQGFVFALLCGVKERFQHPVPDVVQAVVRADRPGFRAHHFHAVVVFGVVAGGDHDAAVHLVVTGGKVHLFGAAQANIKHIGAGRHQAGAQRVGDFGAGQPDVVTDDDFFGAGDFNVGTADFLSQDWV